MVVDRDVPRLVAVDEVHRAVARVVGDVVVDRSQERDVEDQLARGDVRVGDVVLELRHRADEVIEEASERRRRAIHAQAAAVVVIGEQLRHLRVAHLVDDERLEDRAQRVVVRAARLLAEERAGEPLDDRHVREELAHGDLVRLGELARRLGQVDVVHRPLVAAAALEHATRVHAP